MKQQTHNAKPRTSLGTKATRKLRETGMLPVVIYGHGEPPESIMLVKHDVRQSLAHGARTLSVKVGKATKQYLIKEVQYDHFDQIPIHMDLARVDMDERVTVTVSIELRGVPKGISGGGVLDQQLNEIEVECLMTAIPETLHPLVTELELGDTLLVKDLEIPPGVTVLTKPDDRVATITTISEEVEAEEPAEGEVEKTEEPERIGRVRKDEESAEEKK